MHWLIAHWSDALQTLAIVLGLAFNGLALVHDTHSRRVSNLFQLTVSHRELWERLFDHPELRRVLSSDVDLTHQPVTPDEDLFVHLLILHINTAYQAIAHGLMDAPDGFGADLRGLFTLPVPSAVWTRLRSLQDKDFVAFVENHFQGADTF